MGVIEMTKRVLEVGDRKIKVITRDVIDRGYHAKTRVYGAIDALSPELSRELDRWTATPVTAELKRRDPVEAERIMRGYNHAKRAVLRDARRRLSELLERASDELGHVPEVSHFSRTAGCSCGCSPGFVLTECLRPGVRPVDLFIE